MPKPRHDFISDYPSVSSIHYPSLLQSSMPPPTTRIIALALVVIVELVASARYVSFIIGQITARLTMLIFHLLRHTHIALRLQRPLHQAAFPPSSFRNPVPRLLAQAMR